MFIRKACAQKLRKRVTNRSTVSPVILAATNGKVGSDYCLIVNMPIRLLEKLAFPTVFTASQLWQAANSPPITKAFIVLLER